MYDATVILTLTDKSRIMDRRHKSKKMTVLNTVIIVYLILLSIQFKSDLTRDLTRVSNFLTNSDVMENLFAGVMRDLHEQDLKENATIAKDIKRGIIQEYGNDKVSLIVDMNKAANNYLDSANAINRIVQDAVGGMETKLVFFRENNTIRMVYGMGVHECNIGIKIDNVAFPTRYKLMMANVVISTYDNKYFMFNGGDILSYHEVYNKVLEARSYADLVGYVSYVPTYLSWKYGLYGERVLVNGVQNPDATQVIILSELPLGKMVSSGGEKNKGDGGLLSLIKYRKEAIQDAILSAIINSVLLLINVAIVGILITSTMLSRADMHLHIIHKDDVTKLRKKDDE